MRVLFASTQGAGHVGPLLPLAAACGRRGDEVELLVPPAAAAEVHLPGATVTAGGAPPADEMDRLWERFAAATRAEARQIAEREAFAGRLTQAMLPAAEAVMEARRPDVVLREPCEYASALAAARRGIPVATVAISFSEAEWSVLDFVADLLDGYRPGLRGFLGASPFLTRFPRALDRSPFPCTVRYRERARPAGATGGAGPGADDPWPQGRGGRLYVTLGSKAGSMPGAGRTFRTILAAVADLEASVLVTVGRELDPREVGPVPANVAVRGWIDHEEVLSRCDAVICHGGSGTTYGALAHGVPVGFVPLFADQPANARAVVGAGAGLTPDGLSDEDGIPDVGPALVPAIRSMAQALLTDPAYRAAARRLAAETARQPDGAAVAELVAAWVAGGPMPGSPGG